MEDIDFSKLSLRGNDLESSVVDQLSKLNMFEQPLLNWNKILEINYNNHKDFFGFKAAAAYDSFSDSTDLKKYIDLLEKLIGRAHRFNLQESEGDFAVVGEYIGMDFFDDVFVKYTFGSETIIGFEVSAFPSFIYYHDSYSDNSIAVGMNDDGVFVYTPEFLLEDHSKNFNINGIKPDQLLVTMKSVLLSLLYK